MNLPVSQPLQYKGQAGCYTDAFAGLLYCHHRWYDPNLARWLSRDPVGLEGGVNVYEYCGGNPLRFVDPSGLDKKTLRILVVLGDRNKGLWLSQPQVMGPIRGQIEDFYANLGYNVVFDYLHNPSQAAFEKALSNHKVMMYYGHGSDGALALRRNVVWSWHEAQNFALDHPNRLDAAYLFTCEGLEHNVDWGLISKVTFGYGNCVSPMDMLRTPLKRHIAMRAPENPELTVRKLKYTVYRRAFNRKLKRFLQTSQVKF